MTYRSRVTNPCEHEECQDYRYYGYQTCRYAWRNTEDCLKLAIEALVKRGVDKALAVNVLELIRKAQ